MHTLDDKTTHARIQIGDFFMMMSDEFPQMGCSSPTTIGAGILCQHYNCIEGKILKTPTMKQVVVNLNSFH